MKRNQIKSFDFIDLNILTLKDVAYASYSVDEFMPMVFVELSAKRINKDVDYIAFALCRHVIDMLSYL